MTKIHTVTLPDIGEGVIEGEVISWLKQVNDTVAQDEAVVVVMTDKATVELPSPYPGKIVKQYYQPGQLSIKGKPLYDLELAEGYVAIEKPQAKLKEDISKPCASLPLAPSPVQPSLKPHKNVSEDASSASALPSTRKLAQDMGISLDQVTGTGKDGRVTPEDLRHYSRNQASLLEETPLTHLEGDEVMPLMGIKNLMARKMAESKRKIPHFSYFEKVDATRLVRLRQKFKEEGVKQKIQVTYMPFLIRALSLTLEKFPQFNSSIDKNQIIIHKKQHVGIAMA